MLGYSVRITMGPFLIDAFFLSLQALLCNDDKPMMLGYEGNFLNLTFVAIIDLWARILHEQYKNPFERSYNLLSMITSSD